MKTLHYIGGRFNLLRGKEKVLDLEFQYVDPTY